MATGGGMIQRPNYPGAPLIDDDRKTSSESILLHGMNLTIMIGPSPSGGNVASLDSGAAVYKNQQKVMSLC
jgi:hypothetical protein